MDPQKSNSSNEAIRALLLADHAHFSNMLTHNEQSGETRVNWFIGIVTATMGGLLALIVKYQESKQTLLDPALLFAILFAAVCGLLAFGIITLMRMMMRNSSTDRQKRSLDQVRQMFKDYFDPEDLLLGYHPLRNPENKKRKKPGDKKKKVKNKRIKEGVVNARSAVLRAFLRKLRKEWKKGTLRKLGGLAHTVAAINSVLVSSLFGLTVYAVHRFKGWPALPEPNWWPLTKWAIGISIVCILSFAVQWLWIIYREMKERTKNHRGDCTHAGGVVYDPTGGPVKYLLVRPEDHDANEDIWVLPKGKIEEGELHQQTALREVREETGVHAQIVDQLDQVEFKVSQQVVRAKFYLMEKRFEDDSKPRKTKWEQYVEAYKLLTHPESKQLLESAKETMDHRPLTTGH